MSALDLAATMDAIALAVETGNVVPKCHAYPPGSITAPAGIVGYPDDITFDISFGRGSDKAVFSIWICVGKADEASARDRISVLVTGATGIKDALESDPTLGGVIQSCRVLDAQIVVMPVGAVEYLSLAISLEVFS